MEFGGFKDSEELPPEVKEYFSGLIKAFDECKDEYVKENPIPPGIIIQFIAFELGLMISGVNYAEMLKLERTERLTKQNITYSQFKTGLFGVIDHYKASTVIFEADDITTLHNNVNAGIDNSDIFIYSEIKEVVKTDYDELDKVYTCFCLTCPGSSDTLLLTYKKDNPMAVFVDTKRFPDNDAKDILNLFF